jgi:hypothetical protein
MTQLLYLLVGAALAMAAQALIQLRVVPRVEARKRREDRWERDVLALGELLTAELPDRATAAMRDQWYLHFFRTAAPKGGTTERRASTLRELQEKADESVRLYRALADTRITWMVHRIVGIAPHDSQLQKFFLLYVHYRLASAACSSYARPAGDFDDDKFDKEWDSERRAAARLTEAVEALTHNGPPRNPSRLRRARRRLAEQRKARRDEKARQGESELDGGGETA